MSDFSGDIKMVNINRATNIFLENAKKMSHKEFVNYINQATSEQFNLCMTFSSSEDKLSLSGKYVNLINKLIKEADKETLNALINNGLNVFDSLKTIEGTELSKAGYFYNELKKVKTKNDEYKRYEDFFISSLEKHINSIPAYIIANLLDSKDRSQNPDIDLPANKKFLDIKEIKNNALLFKAFHKHRDIEEISCLLKERKKNQLVFSLEKELIYANIFDYFPSKVLSGNIKDSILKVVDSMSEFNNEVLSPNCHKISFPFDFYVEKVFLNPEINNEITIDITKNKEKEPLLALMIKATQDKNVELFNNLKKFGFTPTLKEMSTLVFKNNSGEPFDVSNIFFSPQKEQNDNRYKMLTYFLTDIIRNEDALKKDKFSCDVFFENINFAGFTQEQYTQLFNLVFKESAKDNIRTEFHDKRIRSFFNNLIKVIPKEIMFEMIKDDEFLINFLYFATTAQEIKKSFIEELYSENKEVISMYNKIIINSFHNFSYHSNNDMMLKAQNVLNFFNYQLYNDSLYNNNYKNDPDSLFNNIEIFLNILNKNNSTKALREDLDIDEDFIKYVVNYSPEASNFLLKYARSLNNNEMVTKVEKEIVKNNINLEDVSIKKQKRL